MLGNKATFTDWLEQMWKYCKVKKDDLDKKGWSKRSFARRLDTLKNTGRITGGGQQGDFYSVTHTEEAKRARGGDTTSGAAETGVAETGASQVVTGPPLRGVGPVGTAFGPGVQCQTGAMAPDGTGSSESGNGLNSIASPPINDDESGLFDEAIQHLKGWK